MNTDTTILVSKIEKLWRKANSAGSTPAERDTFEAKALSLMEENRITMAMLEIDDQDILGDYEYGFVQGRYARPVLAILQAVAHAYDCKIWWRTGTTKQVYIFGFKSDAERTKLLARMLIADAQAQATSENGYSPGETFSLRHSFLHGFSSAIAVRLREAAVMANKAFDQEAAKGSALVLVARREQMHTEYSKKRLRSASPSYARRGGARHRGVEAGNSARLSTQGQVVNRKALAS